MQKAENSQQRGGTELAPGCCLWYRMDLKWTPLAHTASMGSDDPHVDINTPGHVPVGP